jgi:hypothetical protein
MHAFVARVIAPVENADDGELARAGWDLKLESRSKSWRSFVDLVVVRRLFFVLLEHFEHAAAVLVDDIGDAPFPRFFRALEFDDHGFTTILERDLH